MGLSEVEDLLLLSPLGISLGKHYLFMCYDKRWGSAQIVYIFSYPISMRIKKKFKILSCGHLLASLLFKPVCNSDLAHHARFYADAIQLSATGWGIH